METIHVYDQVADYLNNIEEVAYGLSYKELIETPIWPGDIRTTPVARTQRRAPNHTCSHPPLRMVEHKIQRSDDVGQKGMAPQNCARRNPRLQSAECWGPRGLARTASYRDAL